MSGRRERSYEKKFIRLSDAVEKWLLRAVAVLLIAMCAGQFLLRMPYTRQIVSPVDRMEGGVFAVPGADSAESGS